MRESPSLIAFSNLLWDTYVGDAFSNYSEGIGGSPTNVAIAFAALGGDAGIVGPAASGNAQTKIARELERYHVRLTPLTPGPLHNGQCLCFQYGSHERLFFVLYPVYETDNMGISHPAWEPASWAMISAYEFMTPGLAEFFIRELQKRRLQGVRIAFDAGDPLFVRKNITYIRRLLENGVEVLLFGEESMVELAGLLQINTRGDDMSRWKDFASIIILTRGERGLTVYHDEKQHSPAINRVQPADTTGAGDILLGSFLWAMDRGYSEERAIELGVCAAEEVVKVVGAHLDRQRWHRVLVNWKRNVSSLN